MKNAVLKGIRFEPEMLKQIEKLAAESERDFSQMVRFICKEWLKANTK